MGGHVLLLWGRGAGTIGGALRGAVAIAGAPSTARKKARAMAGNGGRAIKNPALGGVNQDYIRIVASAKIRKATILTTGLGVM